MLIISGPQYGRACCCRIINKDILPSPLSLIRQVGGSLSPFVIRLALRQVSSLNYACPLAAVSLSLSCPRILIGQSICCAVPLCGLSGVAIVVSLQLMDREGTGPTQRVSVGSKRRQMKQPGIGSPGDQGNSEGALTNSNNYIINRGKREKERFGHVAMNFSKMRGELERIQEQIQRRTLF